MAVGGGVISTTKITLHQPIWLGWAVTIYFYFGDVIYNTAQKTRKHRRLVDVNLNNMN